jgi:hypothetical protein
VCWPLTGKKLSPGVFPGPDFGPYKTHSEHQASVACITKAYVTRGQSVGYKRLIQDVFRMESSITQHLYLDSLSS